MYKVDTYSEGLWMHTEWVYPIDLKPTREHYERQGLTVEVEWVEERKHA